MASARVVAEPSGVESAEGGGGVGTVTAGIRRDVAAKLFTLHRREWPFLRCLFKRRLPTFIPLTKLWER